MNDISYRQLLNTIMTMGLWCKVHMKTKCPAHTVCSLHITKALDLEESAKTAFPAMSDQGDVNLRIILKALS